MSDDFVYRDERDELDLELEDIRPPSAPRADPSAPPLPAPGAAAHGRGQAIAARQGVALPPAPGHAAHVTPHTPPVRTIELRLAQAVDRLAPSTRLAMLTLLIVCMLLVAVSVTMIGWKRVVTQAIEDVPPEGSAIVLP